MRMLQFRCDDASGFDLRIFQARDGDFHISVRPNPKDMEHERIDIGKYDSIYSASVRVRMPMTGGGSHEALWHALAKLFKEPQARVSGHYKEYP